MNNGQKGILLLEAVPTGDTEKKVVVFLSKFAKNTTPERIAAKVKQTPYVLSKNISAEMALKIVKALLQLGASAVFVPHVSTDITTKSKLSFETSDRYDPVPPPLPRARRLAIPKKPQNGKKRLISILVLILLLMSLSFLAWQLYPFLVNKLHDLGLAQREVFVSSAVPASFFSNHQKY